MGLLDNNDSMLDLGMGLLAASGPSRTPIGLGQVLASGYGQMQAGQDRRRQNALEDQKMKLAVDNFDLQKGYKTIQEQQMQLAMQQAQQERADRNQFMALAQKMMQPQPQVAGVQLNGETDAGNVRIQPGAESDVMKAASRILGKQQMGGKLTDDEQWLLDQVKSRAQPVMQQGQPDMSQMAQLSALAQIAGVKGASGLMELAKFNKPDWQQIDNGGQIQFVNKNSGQMPVINKTMSPDAIAANEVARGNLAVNQFNATKSTYHDGALISPTGEVTKTPMFVPPKGSQEAQAQSSARILPLLDQADALLNKATGSTLGSLADSAAGLVGKSTPGAQATAQLKMLEAQIMMAQPRMEGPQSDKDVALYRQMAAQLGDNTVPVETRRAALNGIRQLHEKYAGQSGAPQQSTMSGGGWSATVVK